MPRKPKPPPLLKHGEVMRIAQRADLDVIEERKRLAIEEANQQHMVRRDCLNRMVTSANTTIQDVFDVSPSGHLVPRKIQDLPREVARAIKKLKVFTTTTEKDGVKITNQAVEVELAHHLSYDELIGKYVGLWSDKHLHLHNHNHTNGDGGKLSELTPDQLAARRAQLEAEVAKLEAAETKGKS